MHTKSMVATQGVRRSAENGKTKYSRTFYERV